MTGQIVTNTAINVSVANYDAVCLDAARGILEGYTGDYYFFQYNSDTWCLLLYDDSVMVGTYGLDATDCTVYNIGKTSTDIPYTVSNSMNGTLAGTEQQIFTGAYYTTLHNTTTNYYITSYHKDSVSIRNSSGYLVYGSNENLPHLIEGVQNYAFTGVFICLCIVCFKLFDRIFRRVY